MKILYVSLFTAVICGSFWIGKQWWGKPDRFDHFVERAMIQIVLPDPETISNLGVIDNTWLDFFSDKLTDISYEKNIKYQRLFKILLTTLHRYDKKKLNPQEVLTYDILEHFLQSYLACVSFGYGSYENLVNGFSPYPVNQLFGIQNSLPDFMVNIHQVINRKSAKRYVARLSQWDTKFRNLVEEMKLRESNGVIPPRFIIEKVLTESYNFIRVSPKENMLFTEFKKKLDLLALTEQNQKRIENQTLQTIENKVYPAYLELIAFLEGQKLRATNDAGVWKFPHGDAYYTGALRHHTTTDDSPEEIHALGLSEVGRIQAEMRQILDAVGMKEKSIAEAMEELGKDPRFLYPQSEKGKAEVIADFHTIFEGIQGKLKELFAEMPTKKLKIEAVPDFKAATAPLAYYEPGDLKGIRPGIFYINTHNLHNQTKYTMPTLAYHEGIPGHHLQIARAQEIPNLPTFRRVIFFNAYAEGWALYCEKLASEYGMIPTLYDELGRLQFELMRAARLVVDTGIHSKRWTREQAIQYMMATTGQTLNATSVEIDRYIVLPGQACSYKVGMIKLLQLRERMKQKMGARFEIKVFHELILKNGAMPLTVLERYLDQCLEDQATEL